MSMVHTSLPGARVLDLFAGSGALGLEALSRGAARVDFLENDPRAFRVLRENVELLGAEERCTTHREDALRLSAEGIARGGRRAGARRGLRRSAVQEEPGRGTCRALADAAICGDLRGGA